MRLEKPKIEDLLIANDTDTDSNCIVCYETSKTLAKCCKAPICNECYLKWLETKRQCMHCKADQCTFDQWITFYRVDTEDNYSTILDLYIDEYMNMLIERYGISQQNNNSQIQEILNIINNLNIPINTVENSNGTNENNNGENSNGNVSNSNGTTENGNGTNENGNGNGNDNVDIIFDFYLTSFHNNLNSQAINELRNIYTDLYEEQNENDTSISSILRTTILDFINSTLNNINNEPN
jgi:hypothetical protein